MVARLPRIEQLRATIVRVVAITLLLCSGAARADNVDDLITSLDNDSDRVRISAVLALTNQAAPKSIPALAKRLLDTSEKKNIRGLAATALGRVVQTGNPPANLKKQAVDALTTAKSDPEPFVSSKAEAAISQLGSAVAQNTSASGGLKGAAGVYVNIGPMSSKTNSPQDGAFRAAMEKTAKSTLGKVAPTYQQTWAGGGVPTKSALQQKKFAGFYVDGTLNEVKVTKSGASATISCKVNMLLADFPDKAVFGLLNGGANVSGSSSQKDIDLGTQDCIQAVIEKLITEKIVPTIKTKI